MAKYSYRILRIPVPDVIPVEDVYLIRDDGYVWEFMVVESTMRKIEGWHHLFEYRTSAPMSAETDIIRHLFRLLAVIPGDTVLGPV